MDDIQKLLESKAEQINTDTKLSELEIIKDEITRFLPHVNVHVPKIYPGRKALIIAADGHAASEVKFAQISLLQSLNNILTQPINDLVVIVR